MTEERPQYKPTLREVIGEMSQDLASPVSRTVSDLTRKIKEADFKTPLKDFFILAGGIASVIQLLPYILPTHLKIKRSSKSRDLNVAQNIGGYTGMGVGFLGIMGQAYLYGEHPKYLLVPLATNLASGLYEWQKHAKQRVIEKKSVGQ